MAETEKMAVESSSEKKAVELGAEKTAMVVGIDESDHSFYALQWTLQHFFSSPNPLFTLVVVNAKPTPSSVVGLAGPGAAKVVISVDSSLRCSSERAIGKAKQLCHLVSDAVFEIIEGDPRYVLCEAVQKYHADVLVVGSHGYGALKRAVMGSVSDYCTHHAHCSVMIVKKPKQHKH